jgi:CheY-like chemotaxis protein
MSSPAPAAPIILLAEDDRGIRETTTDLLTLLGAEVLAAPGGHAAAALLAQRQVHLILSDLIMADGDGAWLLQHVRAQPALRGIPFLILSARTEAQDRSAGLAAGANGFITKPYDPEELISTVNHWLRQGSAGTVGLRTLS